MISPEPLYLEKKIAEALGVTRADVRHARKTALKEGRHWHDTERGIVLTPTALAILIEYWRAMGLVPILDDAQLADAFLEPEKNGAADHSVVLLRVTKIFPNPHLLEARFDVTPIDARRVRVWVKTNKNFVPNMRFAGQPKALGSDQFTIVGRCPRRKGKGAPA